jgi:hypothetical protein
MVYPYNGIYYSSGKSNEVLMHAATTQMNLQNVKLSERSQSRRAHIV